MCTQGQLTRASTAASTWLQYTHTAAVFLIGNDEFGSSRAVAVTRRQALRVWHVGTKALVTKRSSLIRLQETTYERALYCTGPTVFGCYFACCITLTFPA